MCLMGGKAKDPMTYEEWRIKDKTAGGDGERSAYDAAVKRFTESKTEDVKDVQTEQEEEIEVAKKTEAQKTAEVKEEAVEELLSTVTAPVSTTGADSAGKIRQAETTVNIESEADVTPLEAMVEEEPIETSLLNTKRIQEQSKQYTGKSKRRSRARGRRSLITGKSGGGIGYYSKYFTQDKS